MNEDETNAVLKLPKSLDFGAAEGFLETMRSCLQDNPRLRVDASGVESSPSNTTTVNVP